MTIDNGQITSDKQSEPVKVKVTRSAARKRTMQAHFDKESNLLSVAVPAAADAKQVQEFIAKCLKKFASRQLMEENRSNLELRARELSKKYFGRLLLFTNIEYTDTYTRAWGKCFPVKKEIYIHRRLLDFPRWVEDYVILHELAHLLEANHSPAFWQLVEVYPLKERAIGYLLAKGIEDEEI